MKLRTLLLITLLISLMLFFFTKKNSQKMVEENDTVQQEQEKEKKKEKLINRRIKSISLLPKIIKTDTDVTIKVELNNPKELKDDEALEFIFMVNGKAVQKGNEEILSKKLIKKKDVIHCQVKLLQKEELKETTFSNMVVVNNTNPVIEEINIPKIKEMGEYQITCKASDIDNEELTFSLETSPKEMENIFSIDNKTGNISFKLTKELDIPKDTKLTLTVKDKDKGIDKKWISLNITKKKIITKKKVNNEKQNKDEKQKK